MFQDEKIVETHICRHCGASFDITDKDLEFYEKISPVFTIQRPVSLSETGLKDLGNGKIKYLIPPPTLCPDCRYQRRLSFRNERKLYQGICAKCGKNMFSMYAPDNINYTVYCQDCGWGDDFDASIYGKIFDFSRSFFEQFGELHKKVPKIALTNTYKSNENSRYVNYIVNSKNSYWCFGGGIIEDCYYTNFTLRSKNCLDAYSCDMCENCLEIVNCKNCFKVFFSSNLENCNNCYLLENCDGCSFCIGCKNLSNKQYYIFNKKVSKEVFDAIVNNFCFNKNKIKKEFESFKLKVPSKNCEMKNSSNCSGNLISDSRNCDICFNVKEGEDIKYSQDVVIGTDIYDTSYVGLSASRVYETLNSSINTSNLLFCCIVRESARDIIYSTDIFGGNNLFGCIGLRNKSYCILNKQYTKEEYEKLVPKIIEHMMKTGEWGEFFPSSLSPFGYNETVAQEYFPINPLVLPLIKGDSQNGVEAGGFYYIDREGNTYNTLEEAGKRPVFKYSTYEVPFPKVEKIIPASKLPENIADIPDDILNWAIECEVTKKPFRIIPQELEFYRKHNLPIPRRHPDQRHLDRMALRNPRKLFERICDCPTCEENHKNIGKYKEEEFAINTKTGKKGKKMQTTYAPERPEIVYCEECYNKEVY